MHSCIHTCIHNVCMCVHRNTPCAAIYTPKHTYTHVHKHTCAITVVVSAADSYLIFLAYLRFVLERLACMQVCVLTHTHANIYVFRTCMHTYIHAYMHAHSRVICATDSHGLKNLHICTCVQKFRQKFIVHVCIHVYMHVHSQ